MANTNWQVSGQYFETCNCDFLCPCISSTFAAPPTHGDCKVAMAFSIDKGRYGNVTLDGLKFVVLADTPGPTMGSGNWAVGLITDARATPEQQQALVQIGSGQGGGPMAALGPLVGKMLGVEARTIQFEQHDMARSVLVEGMLDQAIEGVVSPVKPDEAIIFDNTAHPANARLALAKATRSHLHAFGINWDDTSGKNNGHFAPFNWKSS